MREFMDHVHSAFYEATGWRRDNSYAALNATSDALLNFATPRGLRLTLSSLASPNFATSYQLGSVGVVDGSMAYLFSSVPLRVVLTSQSATVPLPELLRAYRPLSPLPPRPAAPQVAQRRRDLPAPTTSQSPTPLLLPTPSLLYGRLYMPLSQLEALAVRRLSPALQVQLSAVSAAHLRDGGTLLGLAQYDLGKCAFEGLASSDGGLLGLRGVYNFGGDADLSSPSRPQTPEATNALNPAGDRIYGRFTTGGEIYYGTLNKSGGISLGARFATLPAHRGTPLSATMTLNPLMGSVAASYAVVAGRHCSLATRMEFNVLSYESAWTVGMELWRKPFSRLVAADKFGGGDDDDDDDDGSGGGPQARRFMFKERCWQAKLEWRLDNEDEAPKPTELRLNNKAMPTETGKSDGLEAGASNDQEYAGVLKTRLDQNLRIGVLWEGRAKSLLFSLGSNIDLKRLDKPFRTLGLEIQFSS
ncbi:hypothetical protein CDD82_3385 [Ophiocordyceps australis]|uniref:Mitochondrial distribution and morphology protein 10 n=1 Tax=Ophiocordyceps australis TaxID=1399860 RepID=A0A2C5Z778_9HYPO|nr:hypothetical protein CDD82_3385 [Ophiocordyceps australis]